MDIASSEFWAAVVKTAQDDGTIADRTKHAHDLVIAVEIDGIRQYIEFHRGRVSVLGDRSVRGAQCRLWGPRHEWERLFRGNTCYGAAANPYLGRLRLDGDLIAATWLTRGLWELFRQATVVYGEKSPHV